MRERAMLSRMTHPLPASVQSKLDRAQKHIDDLAADIAAFDARKPYRIVQDHNADLTEHYLHLRLNEPFPAYRWGCMLGDAVQNMRAALDHLVYAIAIRESRQDPPPEHTRLMFPILDPPKPLPVGKIRTLSEPVRTAVAAEQPDPSGLDDSMLWRLDQLNIADKHRVIHVALAHSDYGGFSIKPSVPCTFVPKWNARPLDGKAPLLTLTFDRPVPEVEMGSVGSGLVCIERISQGKEPDPLHPWVVGDLLTDLQKATRGIADRVWRAAGL
jgi:hypothetical protein